MSRHNTPCEWPGAERLHRRLFCREPPGKVRSRVPAASGVCDLTARKNALDEAITIARDHLLDPLDLRRIHSDPDNIGRHALPKPSGDFEWVQDVVGSGASVPAARRGGAQHLQHARSGARGWTGGAEAGWRRWRAAVGAKSDALVRMRQVHCADVFDAGGRTTPCGTARERWPEADIAVSVDSSVALTVRAADCVPCCSAIRDRSRRGRSRGMEGHRRWCGQWRPWRRSDGAIRLATARSDRRHWSEHRPVLL